MLFTAYCLSYGNWTVIPSQWQESFLDMKASGFDAVALSFSESEERYAMRTFEMQIKYAHDCGLKVFVIPSRIGGRLAGAPLMSGYWLSEHPECQIPGYPGLAALEDQKFRTWAGGFIRNLVENFSIDGIIWDEPKGVRTLSRHPATLEKFGNNQTSEQAMDSSVEFIAELTSIAKSIKPELIISLFNMPAVLEYFTIRASSIPGIDYTGFDGSCCRQSYFHEEPRKNKHSIRECWPRTIRESQTAGTSTFALVENMCMPKNVLGEFVEELSKFLKECKPDHLSCYYYGHNNESPKEVHEATIKTILDHR